MVPRLLIATSGCDHVYLCYKLERALTCPCLRVLCEAQSVYVYRAYVYPFYRAGYLSVRT